MKRLLILLLVVCQASYGATTLYPDITGIPGSAEELADLIDANCDDGDTPFWDEAEGKFGCDAPGAASMDWSVEVDSTILPDTDDTYDLGSAAAQFQDAWFNGTLEADAITLNGTALGSLYTALAATTDNYLIRANGTGGQVQGATTVSLDDSDNMDGLASISEFGTQASAGFIRMKNNNSGILWRNAANDGDLGFWVSGDDALQLSAGLPIVAGSGSPALSGFTIDADATGTVISNIENADIKAAAAIAVNKLAALTASEAVVTDGSGFLASATGVSATELGYVNGVTSAIQTQLDGKAPTDGDGIVEAICGHIETPSDKAYFLRLDSPYPFTINSISTDVDSGTAAGALEVNGTPVTGCTSSDISISSTEVEDTCTAGNTVSAGDDLELVISSNSSSDDLRFCVNVTRD
jgi:hypothetical protein